MTEQDLVNGVAAIIRDAFGVYKCAEAEALRLKIACDIANWRASDDPAFDRSSFLRACAVTNEKGQRAALSTRRSQEHDQDQAD